MTCGLIKLKLEEHRLADKVKLVTHEPGDVVKAGSFTVEFIHVNHSIPDAVAFAIRTPVGTVVFTGDFKIDPTSHRRHDGSGAAGRAGKAGRAGDAGRLHQRGAAGLHPQRKRGRRQP